MLFSEPKIPQCSRARLLTALSACVSVLFSEPKIPQSGWSRTGATRRSEFQCSSASRKFLNRRGTPARPRSPPVSVLFSEPKIPQLIVDEAAFVKTVWFQCSSASRKFLNRWSKSPLARCGRCFSALQRAENSSITRLEMTRPISRKGFSALQRAENSSIISKSCSAPGCPSVSVLFSEPKIPQFSPICEQRIDVEFQCSSASRKFLNTNRTVRCASQPAFQCSSASRKFLNFCSV